MNGVVLQNPALIKRVGDTVANRLFDLINCLCMLTDRLKKATQMGLIER